MAFRSPITLHASAAESASGAAVVGVEIGPKTTARLSLSVTTVTGGSPSLTVVVETSADHATWRELGRFAPVSSVAGDGAVQYKVFTAADRYVRARWEITGTGSPSFTFALSGEAVLVYATPLFWARRGAPLSIWQKLSEEDRDRFLVEATDKADTRLRGRYKLPPVSWGDDLRGYTCDIATWLAMTNKVGFNPESGPDIAIRDTYRDAIKDLDAISVGSLSLSDEFVDQTPDIEEGGAYVVSEPLSRWSRW